MMGPGPFIRLFLPIRIVSEANRREHWAAKAKRAKAHRNAAHLALKAELQKHEPLIWPVVVTLTRVSPRKLDGDNLQSGFKAVRDGVADALGLNDGSDSVQWRYEWLKSVEPRKHHIAIAIEDRSGRSEWDAFSGGLKRPNDVGDNMLRLAALEGKR